MVCSCFMSGQLRGGEERDEWEERVCAVESRRGPGRRQRRTGTIKLRRYREAREKKGHIMS